jgi:ankyrin repeat protein
MNSVIFAVLLAIGLVLICGIVKKTDMASVFHGLVSAGNTMAIRILLTINPALINIPSGTCGETPLHRAVRHNKYRMIDLLLARGAAVNAKDSQESTPLHYAARGGDDETGKVLLARGADLNAVDNCGRTPLHLAAQARYVSRAEDMAELLLSHGAQLEARDLEGRTPLMYAARDGKDGIAVVLITSGAEINTKDNMGTTPLAYASESLHLSRDVVDLLISKGANINAIDKDGGTPLDYALHTIHGAEKEEDQKKLEQAQREIIELLRRNGAREPGELPPGSGRGATE